VASCDHNVYALNAATGAKIWNYTTGSYGSWWMTSSPAVAGGVVFVGSDIGNVYALSAATGAKIWNYTAGHWDGYQGVMSSPAVANGIVFAGAVDGKIYALNATTGALVWQYETGNGTQVNCSPAVADGIVYIGSNNYKVYAFGPAVPPPPQAIPEAPFGTAVACISMLIALAGFTWFRRFRPKLHLQ
jgi:serine/threonine-protein kinase